MKQKATTIAIIIISLAMLGAAAAATTITMTSYNVIQQTFATRTVNNFCYHQTTPFNFSATSCYDNNGACKKAQSSDTQANSDCFKTSQP
jgi:hypothetical protein